MNKTIRILAIVLAVQAAVSAYSLMGRSSLEATPANSGLLSFEVGQVDHLVVNDAEQASTEIVKQGGKWVLPAADGFPADQAKVGKMLDTLHGLKRGLPVAASGADFARFKVDDKGFERHVLLKKGNDVVADLYLGNGAGVNRSYARISQDKAVYDAMVGTYDLPASPNGWEDKTVLNLADKDVSAIGLNNGLKLARTVEADKTGDWQAATLETGKRLQQAAVNQWLSQLTAISFDKVLGKEAKPDYGLDQPVLAVTLTYGKSTRTYQFGKLKDGDNYVLKVSDRPEFFQLAGFTVKPLLDGGSNDKLLESVAPPPAMAPAQPAPALVVPGAAPAPAVPQPAPAVAAPPPAAPAPTQ